MAKPYSNDLRQKAIDAIELNGMKRCETAELFGISRNSINSWFNRKAETGTIEPKKREKHGHSHKITDWKEFRDFVQKNHDKTQAEMAELWPHPISGRTIGRGLKKIGFTRKSGQTPRRRYPKVYPLGQAQGNADQDRRAMGIGKEMRKSVLR